jgi:hypothetical protein
MDSLAGIADTLIQERVDRFKQGLEKHDSRTMVHRFVLGADCYALTHDSHMLLKETVAKHFAVPSMEINIVGSAKLGFTISPENPRYRAFGDDSDIDIAIVSSQLFDTYWEATYELGTDGGILPWLGQFRRYLYRGWIRPDLWPRDISFSIATEWWDFFRDLSTSGEFDNLKIRGGLYRTWSFLESYQAEAVEKLRSDPLENLT